MKDLRMESHGVLEAQRIRLAEGFLSVGIQVSIYWLYEIWTHLDLPAMVVICITVSRP